MSKTRAPGPYPPSLPPSLEKGEDRHPGRLYSYYRLSSLSTSCVTAFPFVLIGVAGNGPTRLRWIPSWPARLGWPSTRYLHSFLPALLVSMEEHGEIVLTEEERRLLLQMSPSTMERRLAPIRRREGSRLRRAPTKPGSRLQARIPVRTWKDRPTSPGWMEFDLVAHSGSWSDGEFFWTINGVDFATGRRFFLTGESVPPKEAMATRLPFALRGIDSDNDSAFINQHLFRYCQQRKFRSRPYRKNDQGATELDGRSAVCRIWPLRNTRGFGGSPEALYGPASLGELLPAGSAPARKRGQRRQGSPAV